jgi:hypothetical protein
MAHSVARAGAVFGLLLAMGAVYCRPGTPTRPPIEELLLERQRQGLEGLIAAAREGRLIPFDQVLMVVPQQLVQDLIMATLPYEQDLQSRYRVRVASVRVAFEDGFGLIHLRGSASLVNDASTAAEIEVYGGMDIVDLDPQTGILRGRIKVLALETQRVDVVGFPAPVRQLVDDLSREQLTLFEPLLSNIEIPIKLEHEIAIPAVNQAGIRIDQATLPLEAAVVDVKAFRGKLWICASAKAALEAHAR